MAITTLTLANTFFDWMTATNQLSSNMNNLTANTFTKTDGTLFINSANTGLYVANTGFVNKLTSNNISVIGSITYTGAITNGGTSVSSSGIATTGTISLSGGGTSGILMGGKNITSVGTMSATSINSTNITPTNFNCSGTFNVTSATGNLYLLGNISATAFSGFSVTTTSDIVSSANVYANRFNANVGISLANTTSNLIDFNTAGIAPPSNTTRSLGTKIVLYPQVSASTVDHAIGVDAATVWHSIVNNASSFKWYANTSLIGQLYGTGVFSLPANIVSTSNGTGTLVVTGGVGITGNNYITGNLNVTGTETTTGNKFVSGYASIGTAATSGLTFSDNQINSNNFNGVNEIAVNYNGYNGGITQFRNFNVYDGKQASLFSITGATKNASFAGGISINANYASSSTTTGSLVVTGGVGISSDVNCGGAGSFNGNFKSGVTGTNGLSFIDNQIGTPNVNGVSEIAINFNGFNNGITQFRNFTVYDGKQASLFSITGATKNASFSGFLNTSSASAAGLTFSDNQINSNNFNGVNEIAVNYNGYNGGITQFRNFNVYNGKQGSLFSITGSTGNAILSSGSLFLNGNVASTSNSTGSLVVTGGVGVTGNVYSSGNIQTTSKFIGTNAVKAYFSANNVGGIYPAKDSFNFTSFGSIGGGSYIAYFNDVGKSSPTILVVPGTNSQFGSYNIYNISNTSFTINVQGTAGPMTIDTISILII